MVSGNVVTTKPTSQESLKPLLQWMVSGDADLVPVMLSDERSLAASYFGVRLLKTGTSASFTGGGKSAITPDIIVQCSQETGIHVLANLGCVTPLDIIEFVDDIDMTVTEKLKTDGRVYRSTTICTPAGEMSEVFLTPPDLPACWKEHLVKTEADLPAFTYLIERTNQALVGNRDIRERIITKFQDQADQWPAHVPAFVIMGVPAFTLMSNLYMDAAVGFYLLEDHRALMERLFETEAKTNAIVLECAAQAGADIVRGAMGGLELFSPTIYQRYLIPQAQVLCQAAHTRDMLSWIHTCGYMRKLISMGAYETMGVDVLETLSHPPVGDIDDLHWAREKLGQKMTTRGGVNVELFYGADQKPLRERIRTVLGETRGYRHIIGDSNDSYPPYPRESILAIVEEVQKTGRMLPAY